jgi:hypothetical protein
MNMQVNQDEYLLQFFNLHLDDELADMIVVETRVLCTLACVNIVWFITCHISFIISGQVMSLTRNVQCRLVSWTALICFLTCEQALVL